MKNRIAALFLASFVCFSLAACGADGSISGPEENAAAEAEAEETEEAGEETEEVEETEEEIQIEIPDSIVNISPEDDKALTGVLTEDSYTNEYFGLVFNKIPGAAITPLFDEGTELTLLSETYANGFGGVYVYSSGEDYASSLSVAVTALTSADQGKSEEELAQERLELEQNFNEAMGVQAENSVENISIAGEEHSAYVEIADYDGFINKYATVFIIKNDFLCNVEINGEFENFDEIVKLIEPLN